MSRFVIAIDGPSASGKGSLAKIIANNFSLPYLNSGALYRAVAYLLAQHLAMNQGLKIYSLLLQYLDDGKNTAIVKNLLPQLVSKIFTIDLEKIELFSEEVGAIASRIAKLPELRTLLFSFQQDFIAKGLEKSGGAVVDGRDIASVIYPQADFKFFIQASAEVRATRRFKQLNKDLAINDSDIASNPDYQIILQQIISRDQQDYNREIAPLKILPDSILISNETLSLVEVAEKMINIINAKISLFLNQ
jgi:cytidylate kinase